MTQDIAILQRPGQIDELFSDKTSHRTKITVKARAIDLYTEYIHSVIINITRSVPVPAFG